MSLYVSVGTYGKTRIAPQKPAIEEFLRAIEK
jgi:hypothetical protein